MYLFHLQNLADKHIHEKVFVIPYDLLPKGNVKLPFCAIINNSRSSQKGSHWTSLVINEAGVAFFFDSYGIGPQPIELKHFIKMHSRKLVINTRQIQRINSKCCGLYAFLAIFFIINRKSSLEDFVAQFSQNLYLNDFKVENMFQNFLK